MIVSGSLDLSLPLVNGTIQNEHILLHPLIIDTKVVLISIGVIGWISSYVSYIDKSVLDYLIYDFEYIPNKSGNDL